jgi:hypothetical protein
MTAPVVVAIGPREIGLQPAYPLRCCASLRPDEGTRDQKALACNPESLFHRQRRQLISD